jgi:hypothetical protein
MRTVRHPITIFIVAVLAVIGIVTMVLAMTTLTDVPICAGASSWRALPRTTGQLGAQNPQLHGGPIWPAQALISSNVSAQTFW